MPRRSIIKKLSKLTGYHENKCLRYLIGYLYQTTSFIGAKYKEKVYRELPNQWAHRDDFTEAEQEKGCDGYMDECELESRICTNIQFPAGKIATLAVLNSSDFKIEFLYEHVPNDYEHRVDEENESENDYSKFETKEVQDYLSRLPNKGNVLLIEESYVIYNPCGINDDHRGSDHCELELPFIDKIKITNPSLHDFISALYLLKSHKFDKWYELYTGSKIQELQSGNRVIVLEFDHGS
jgi:hypothetical protein